MINVITCSKKTYLTRWEAKQAIKNPLLKKSYKLTNVYFCDVCKSWHTTSMPKQKSRDYKRFLINQEKRKKNEF